MASKHEAGICSAITSSRQVPHGPSTLGAKGKERDSTRHTHKDYLRIVTNAIGEFKYLELYMRCTTD